MKLGLPGLLKTLVVFFVFLVAFQDVNFQDVNLKFLMEMIIQKNG